MTRRALLDLAATLRRLKIRCDLDVQDSIYFTTNPDEVRGLRREDDARRTAGLEGSWLTAARLRRETALMGEAGILMRASAHVDPYRACLGLASAGAKRGALIYERSPVTRVRFDAKGVDVRTLRGTIRAERVVIATGDPSALFRPLVRHVRLTETYLVATPPLAAAVRAELGRRAAMLRDTEDPSHDLRWTRDDRIVFEGADQPTTALRSRQRILVQRAGQLMYELSRLYPVISGIRPEFAWRCPVVSGVDGLPFIGPHRNYPRHLFALGGGGNPLVMGFLASRLLLRHHLEQPAQGDELFGFARLGAGRSGPVRE
jgi:glycine/D-amino acid oxidase-like deaminating enzyme